MQKSIVRLIAAALLSFAVAAGVITATATPAVATHRCKYEVTDNSYVRENPSINSDPLKTKYAGDIVIGQCGLAVTDNWGHTWQHVECGCASDGDGWMIQRKLRFVGGV